MRPREQRSCHVGESCAFADGPAVWPISKGQRQRIEELRWRFTSLDAALSPHRQVEHLSELIDLGVNALTAFTMDDRLAEPEYARAAAAGIPVVTFGSLSPSSATAIRQRVDSESCAADAAAYLAERVPKARVLVIGGPPVPALAARTHHFMAAAARAGLRIVAREDNVGDVEETARPIAERLLDRHPDIDAIWCFNDYTALAAAGELRRRGQPVQSGACRGVIVSGIGGLPALIEAIREGQVTFTYDSHPVETGRAAINALEDILLRKQQPAREVWIDFVRYEQSNVLRYVPWEDR
jgi:ribose transport system substrate-binding protein